MRKELNNEPKESQEGGIHNEFAARTIFISISGCYKCKFYVLCLCDLCDIQSRLVAS